MTVLTFSWYKPISIWKALLKVYFSLAIGLGNVQGGRGLISFLCSTLPLYSTAHPRLDTLIFQMPTPRKNAIFLFLIQVPWKHANPLFSFQSIQSKECPFAMLTLKSLKYVPFNVFIELD